MYIYIYIIVCITYSLILHICRVVSICFWWQNKTWHVDTTGTCAMHSLRSPFKWNDIGLWHLISVKQVLARKADKLWVGAKGQPYSDTTMAQHITTCLFEHNICMNWLQAHDVFRLAPVPKIPPQHYASCVQYAHHLWLHTNTTWCQSDIPKQQ